MPVLASNRPSHSFGHYSVLTRPDGRPEELGRGAMGITYKALDTTLERFVALKVINPDHLSGEDTRQRFLREARAAAQLRHPNVAGVFHLGVEEGTHFYAMEFIDGETLEARVNRLGPLSCGLALDLAAQAAGALEAAHAARIVHRDIKPANLMVVNQPGGRLLLKVIDFGLAKSAVAGARDATVTVGGFLGTPHFASPEQLEEKDLDIRSDIYSLGATLWHLLTGRTLYSGSLARVMIGHISETPPYDRLVAPPALRALLRRMLGKSAEDRPQTPATLLTEIHAASSQLGDPGFVCRLEMETAFSGCVFTLQELLRVRRALPAEEALPILRRIAEALDTIDSTGQTQVELAVHAISLDFPEQATVSAADLMRQPVGQWPAFGLKMRDRDPTVTPDGATISNQVTLFAVAMPQRDDTYLQRLAGITTELLGGRQRAESSDTDGEFVPLAALTEDGNAILRAALTERASNAYASGMEFLDALQAAEGIALLPVAATPLPPTEIVAPTQKLELVSRIPAGALGPVRPPRRNRMWIAALIVAGGVSASYVALHKPGAGTAHASPPPVVSNLPPATSLIPTPSVAREPVSDSTPVPLPPKPAPEPALNADQQLKLALGEAAEDEAALNWKGALEATVKVVRDFPTYDRGPARLEDLIQRMNTKGEFSRHWPALKPALDDAAGLGSGHATFLLALAAQKDDPTGAQALVERAANLGVHEAMTMMGLQYLRGEGGRPKDLAEAERWFQWASDHGDPGGTLILGECYLSGKGVKQDNAKALKLIQDAAEHRSGDAKNLLGKLYLYGQAGLPLNRLTAVEYFRQAKELKCPEAFYNLGMLAYSSKGLMASPARAASLFEGGAKLGHPLSMFYYGRCLDQGMGTPVSRSDAQVWYNKAIEPLKKEVDDGSRAAMVCYAMALDQGLGILRNTAEARRWYVKAATLGDPSAQEWCLQNRVDFALPPSSPTSPALALPHRVVIGKRSATP